jgi:hypothetical protein
VDRRVQLKETSSICWADYAPNIGAGGPEISTQSPEQR